MMKKIQSNSLNNAYSDPLYNKAMNSVKETGYLSFMVIRSKWRELYEDNDRAMLIYASLISEFCQGKVSEEIINEYIGLYKQTSDALEEMINKAILGCDKYNDYADIVSKFIVYSRLCNDEDIEDRIIRLFNPYANKDEKTNGYSKESHNRRIHFALHLFGAYLESKRCIVDDRFSERFFEQLKESVRMITIRESVMNIFAYLCIQNHGNIFKDYIEYDDHSGLFYSAAISYLWDSGFNSRNALWFLWTMPVVKNRKDDRLRYERFKRKIWKHFMESSDLAEDLVWIKTILHADPDGAWLSKKRYREDLKRKTTESEAHEGKFLSWLFGSPSAEYSFSDSAWDGAIDKLRQSSPLCFFINETDIQKTAKDVIEQVQNICNSIRM